MAFVVTALYFNNLYINTLNMQLDNLGLWEVKNIIALNMIKV
jgi:hypothetical protein